MTDERQRPGARIPRWTKRANDAIARAAQRVRIIYLTTPLNLRAELERLERAWHTEGDISPRFDHAEIPDHRDLRAALSSLADELEAHGPLGALYSARAREIEREAALCEAVGKHDFWAAARRRYPRRDAFDELADQTAAHWLDEPPPSNPPPSDIRSDDEHDPRSLVSRIRNEFGKRKLPLRVIVRRDIASLAATGDGFVHVIADKRISHRDVERTVLHEIEGHVLPRLNAATAPLGIFAIGTAFGSDDQEGRALALERAHGFLDHARRREIALRHTAARAVEARADFPTTARLLVDRGAELPTALRIAARAHRGGGLAREVVYLPALLRVEAALQKDPHLDRVLASGRVSVDAAPLLRDWIHQPSAD